MSYTNVDLIKNHINFEDIPAGWKRNYSIVFAGTDWVVLPGFKVVSGSVTVKTIKNYNPETETIVLGSSAVSLAKSKLADGSVTVASDSSIGTIFKENVDYYIDYDNGVITRLNDGAIPDTTSLTVWYYYYDIYSEDTDYQVDYQNGKVKRNGNGDINDSQTVLVDYELSTGQVGNEALAEAVTEANAIIEKQVDPDGSFGADLTLQTAATYLAVSLVCRIAAINELKFNQLGRQNASSWLALSESYRDDYKKLLEIFRPETARLNKPTHS